jgi:hypothetical protein
LRHDLDCFGGDDEQEDAEDKQYEQQQEAAQTPSACSRNRWQ